MKNTIKTDLACESYEAEFEKNSENGLVSSLYELNDYSIIETKILNGVGEKITGKKMGKYLTLYAKNVWKYNPCEQKKVCSALSFCIKSLLTDFNLKSPSFLVAGLGNRQIKADALGPLCIDRLIPTHHLKKESELYGSFGYDLSLVKPLVLGEGGIESSLMVKGAIECCGASCLILIDALSTSNIDRLCTTFQISNTGLTPASAIEDGRQEISRETMGIPVISIGVPCAISIDSILSSFASCKNSTIANIKSSFLVAPKEIDIIAPVLSKIIADSITDAIKDN